MLVQYSIAGLLDMHTRLQYVANDTATIRLVDRKFF